MSLEIDVVKKLGEFQLKARLSHPGKITGILGPSGCGKSLTLQMIAGVRTPDRGRIVLNGRVLYDSEARVNIPPQRRRVGYLFQNYALFPTMSVEQNIECGIPRSVPRQRRKQAAREWMRNMRLDETLAQAKPWQLSGGQQQRVALARVLISEPEILLLDEPFSALDAFLRERMVTEVKAVLHERGREALLVTHSRDEAYELCQTLAIMEDGNIVESGETRALFSRPQTSVGAIVTGCKNVEEARKTGPFEVFAPAWNVRLTTAYPVPDSVCAVGLRAHYFSPDIEQNRFPVKIVEEVEEPFAWIIGFRYEGGSERSVPVWWRMSKDCAASRNRRVGALGIAPESVLPLSRPD